MKLGKEMRENLNLGLHLDNLPKVNSDSLMKTCILFMYSLKANTLTRTEPLQYKGQKVRCVVTWS